MKTIMMKMAFVGLLVFGSATNSGCDTLKRIGAEIRRLFDCDCLCQCAEGYRGGGDGVNGGGTSFRCIPMGNSQTCQDACSWQSLTSATGGGNLVACIAI